MSNGTDSVIDGLAKKAEIAAKENISSGFPLAATTPILHRQLVKILSNLENMPLDVFDNIEVIREEHYCIPSYCFEYNGEAPFSYEEGKQETRQEKGFSGDSETITTIREVKWHTERGNASVSGILFASGNKKMAPYANKMYINTDHSKLVDLDSLNFPSDVITLDCDFPQLTVFNEIVKHIVDELLKKEGKKALDGTSYESHIPRGGRYGETYTKNFKMSGSKIQKDVTHVFLGLYRIVFKYSDKEYSIWLTGDGEKTFHEGMPEDTQRQKTLDDKRNSMEAELLLVPKPKTGGFTFGIVASIIGGIILAIQVHPISLVIGLIGIIVFGVLSSKAKKPYEMQCAQIKDKWEREINNFVGQTKDVVQKFKSQKKALRGIYESVSGDASAF